SSVRSSRSPSIRNLFSTTRQARCPGRDRTAEFLTPGVRKTCDDRAVMVLPVARLRRLDVPPDWLVVLSTASVQVGASVAAGLFVAYGPITIVALRLVFGAVLVDLYRRPRLRGTSGPAWRD